MLYRGIGKPPFPAPFFKRPTSTPQDILGSKLVAFCDAEDNSRITNVSGAVSAYSDLISAASYAQAVAGSRPAITTNAITGRQVFRFDGTDDQLEFTGIPAGVPTGANPGEIIFIGAQSALAADTTQRIAINYGGTSAGSNRVLRRVVTSLISQFGCGTGSNVTVDAPNSAAFVGNHLLRGIADGTTIYADLDGVVSAGVASIPGTNTTRLRIGANTANTAANFWLGDLSAFLITNAVLTAAEFNAIAVWAGPRIWG